MGKILAHTFTFKINAGHSGVVGAVQQETSNWQTSRASIPSLGVLASLSRSFAVNPTFY
jgi:hypothetical protein